MDFATFLFPKYCILCKNSSKWICTACAKKLIYTLPICYICKKINNGYKTHPNCEMDIRAIFTGYRYSKEAKQILKEIKYNYSYRLIPNLLEGLMDKISHYVKPIQDESLLIPIPLHYIKKLSRGFNQAEEITKYISKATQIPYSTALIKRVKNTKPQSTFAAKKRKSNIENAFQIKDESLLETANTIILVDDVITSGSTLNEVARIIKERNAGINIYGLTTFNGLHKRAHKKIDRNSIKA